MVRAAMRTNKRTKPSEIVGLGKKAPILGKLVQLIGIVLLYLVGLSGSGDI
jgi:hypothetical protein